MKGKKALEKYLPGKLAHIKVAQMLHKDIKL
jgi:hypothetical protein